MEINFLSNYSKQSKDRLLKRNFRTIEDRIIASYKDRRFYDGSRSHGYGGYKYDGRWENFANNIYKKYKLDSKSKVLHIYCDKGFLLYELYKINPKMELYGFEISKYAKQYSKKEIKNNIIVGKEFDYNFNNNYFDLIMAFGYVYTFNLQGVIENLKNISKISKNSYVTLASYNDQESYSLFKSWTLLGTTVLKKNEWKKVIKHAKYTGDYEFANSSTLNLKYAK